MKHSLLLAFGMIICFVQPVQAALRDEVKTAKDDLKAARCTMIENRVNFRQNLYQQNRDKHYQIYQGVRKRIGALVDKLGKRAGCDVTDLKADLTQFDGLIADYAAAFRDFNASFQGVRENRCQENQNLYTQSVNDSKQKLSTLKQKAQAVHTYFKTTIQPALSQKAKTCRPSPKPTAKPSASPIIEGEN